MADVKALPSQISKQQQKLSAEQRKEIAKRLLAIAEAVGEKFSAERLDIYLQAFSDLPFERITHALESMIMTTRWFPKIPDVREAVLGGPHDLENSAWDKIVKKIEDWKSAIECEADAVYSGFSCARGMATFDLRDLNPYEKLALTRLGGPRSLASANPAYIPLLKKQFVEEYSYVRKEHAHLLVSENQVELPEEVKQLAEKKKMPA